MSTMFSFGHAHDYFETTIQNARNAVERAQLSALEERFDEIVDTITQQFALTAVELGEPTASTEEVVVEANRFAGAGFFAPGQSVRRPGTRVTISVPFTGSTGLLQHQPQTFDLAPNEATIAGTTVYLIRDFVDPQTEQVKAWRDQELGRLRSRVGNANAAVAGFNDRLKAQVVLIAENRRTRLRGQRSLEDELNS
jgi:hypothetical protein